MKKESKASKIAGGFNDGLDIDKLASMASQMSTPSVSAPKPAVVAVEQAKKDRRFTIILPHDLYMKMVPEIGAYNQRALLMNIDNGRYPQPRTYTFGVNLEF